MINDDQLLRRFIEGRAEEAFAELVQRHVDVVYSAALRQVNGDVHLAKDVVQLVFTDLARKAPTLTQHRVLAGWLFVSTRYAAAKLVRSEQRRRAREQEALLMDAKGNEAEVGAGEATGADWARVRPVLDEALAALGTTDREAILLRFFEGRGFAEVGERLELSENSARMRVERALDKLHGLLARRGVTSTTGALAAALAGHAVTAAPAGLAASVAVAAVAGAAVGGGVAVAGFMGMTKLQLGITAAIAVAGTGGWVSQQREAEAWRGELAGLSVEAGDLETARAEHRARVRAEQAVERGRANDAEAGRIREDLSALARQLEDRAREARVAAATRRATGAAAAQARVAAALKRATEQGAADLAPRVSETARPVYPAELRANGITGEVVVEFVVGADGVVRDAQAVQSTRPEFEGAAEDALMQWTFEPGIRGRRPVNTRIAQRVTFALPDSDRPPGELKPVDRSGGVWLP